ncbi:hypothetical protein NP233_g6615 [Leucocoprinus birnbaumii]|uniref:Uncharacterized protein n=1 Tax=Leucocoprinus birnbaumii TaxID=56174 RepID=A0AAD5VT15_9AGAR|nr:hypothetical protein NP233_g6615 [Leucocoprinus birnbaumii]
MSSTLLSPTVVDFPKSRIRRKPITTYKSPSASDNDPKIALSTRNDAPNIPSQPPSDHRIPSQNPQGSLQVHRRKRSKSHVLPLYHPLGELALSLPPLNPADFGLPLPRLSEETSRKSSSNFRAASVKPPDVDEEEISIPSVSSIAAVAANEVKRASPRKRRVGMGGGKRRRKETDDGDATYPAKRTRQTRAGGGDEIDFDEAHGQGDGDGTPEADGPAERRPERRSTRSRTKRRDSSEVESVEEQPIQDSLSVSEEIKQTTLEGVSEGAQEEKEEGEISGDP